LFQIKKHLIEGKHTNKTEVVFAVVVLNCEHFIMDFFQSFRKHVGQIMDLFKESYSKKYKTRSCLGTLKDEF
jgi:hypothetical protein